MLLLQHPSSAAPRRTVSVLLLLGLGACATPSPVVVNSTLIAQPALATRSPSQVAVLPVEDGTADGSVQRHLVFLRQELMRQLPSRLFTPLTATTVDAALNNVAKPAPGDSIVVPATLQKLAGHAAEDAVFALRVERWDENRLHVDRTLRFQFQAALIGSDGVQLWGGSIQGEIKAGGAGPAPRDKEGMARSCGELAVREMIARLPLCTH
ncbi:MAG: hypothetical protein WAT39_04575 [Planctomycetota bacterium]